MFAIHSVKEIRRLLALAAKPVCSLYRMRTDEIVDRIRVHVSDFIG